MVAMSWCALLTLFVLTSPAGHLGRGLQVAVFNKLSEIGEPNPAAESLLNGSVELPKAVARLLSLDLRRDGYGQLPQQLSWASIIPKLHHANHLPSGERPRRADCRSGQPPPQQRARRWLQLSPIDAQQDGGEPRGVNIQRCEYTGRDLGVLARRERPHVLRTLPLKIRLLEGIPVRVAHFALGRSGTTWAALPIAAPATKRPTCSAASRSTLSKRCEYRCVVVGDE
jgi:hypothetical protein